MSFLSPCGEPLVGGDQMGNFAVRRDDGVFHLFGEFDLAQAKTFAKETEPALGGGDSVVLDLRGLTFIDSSGVRSIILLARRCGRRGIVLRSPRGEVAKVFGIVRLGDVPGITIEGEQT
jgi:anti-sigma B factor antagonist